MQSFKKIHAWAQMKVPLFSVLNVRDGTESKYPSIVFLSIHRTYCVFMI